MTSEASNDFNLESLARSIQRITDELSIQASKAVNVSLTVRNWLIGHYIAEFELNGADRATYGDKMLDRLAIRLKELDVPTCDKRRLYQYLRFYQTYPSIVRSLTAQSRKLLLSEVPDAAEPAPPGKVRSLTAQSQTSVLQALSYTHIELLVGIDGADKRAYYEAECIQGGWSVRELRRQINSLLYERSGLSTKPAKLAEQTHAAAEQEPNALTIRDPYVFEFLGLSPQEVMSESHLEDQLLDRLQAFLLELGQGFCFEARQRRILIGDTYNFVDMVFYHRILKCHVLVDVKLDEFSHENIGQLNTYVSWYDRNVRTADDNPPVGILLCTEKDHALVEYALAGMDNSLFVSRYQLELPSREVLQKRLEQELYEIESAASSEDGGETA